MRVAVSKPGHWRTDPSRVSGNLYSAGQCPDLGAAASGLDK